MSAYTGKTREGWNRLNADIRSGRIDVVLIDRQDRLARTTLETELFKVICKDAGVVWQFSDGSKLDVSKHTDGMVATLRGMFAQQESDVKKERLHARFESEIADGMPLWGVRPFGFDADPDAPVGKNGKRSKRWTVHHATEAEELRRAYRTFLDTGKVYPILKDWNTRGILTTRGKPWAYASVQQLLKRARNAGLVEHHGVIVEGVEAAWEPLVSREDYDAVLAIMSDAKRRTVPGPKPGHLLSTIPRCGVCGGVMRSSTGNGEPVLKCSSKLNAQAIGERHPAIAMRLVEPLVERAVVDAFLFAPRSALPGEAEPDVSGIELELSKVRAARSRLIKLTAGDDAPLDEGDIAAELTGLKRREIELDAERDRRVQESARASLLVDLRAGFWEGGTADLDEAVRLRGLLGERFRELPLDRRRELVRALVDVRVHAGRSIRRVEIVHKVATGLNEDETAA